MRTIPELLNSVAVALPYGPLRDEVTTALATFTQSADIGRRLRLTAKEQAILDTLTVTGFATNDQLLHAGNIATKNALNVHRCRLNQKLRKWGYGEIVTRRGVGYEWVKGDGNGA